jgi:hypothetical protein
LPHISRVPRLKLLLKLGTALWGQAGDRAALVDKFIERTSVPKEFEATFDSDSREAKEWEKLFLKATMAHLLRKQPSGSRETGYQSHDGIRLRNPG